jgi:hypothetical protein
MERAHNVGERPLGVDVRLAGLAPAGIIPKGE